MKVALENRQIIEVAVIKGWRADMLAKEVGVWANSKAKKNCNGGAAKSPSFFCNLMNMRLFAFHWFAISADYEMQIRSNDNEIVLIYAPI